MPDTASAVSRPRYAPYAGGRFALAMGLMALDLERWIEVDERYAEELAEKERLLAERHGDVFAALPGSETAQRETLVLLLDHMTRHFPDLVRFHEGEISVPATGRTYRMADFRDRALDLAGRLVQEDLCLMRPGPDGYVLHAASLCFPARWLLAEKLGQPMMGIHERVAGYGDKLGRPVDRFFEHLAADKPVQRLNWSINDDPALFQTGGKFRSDREETITAANAGDRLWLRVERQTLRRLPESGDILFTIKTYVDPLSCLAARPELARGLRSAITEMPEGMRLYKSLGRFADALDGYLARIGG